uniref:E1 ubiquitin-activating enzyme n=1 Tax=Pygocentrus nattereri TaxID=42514 RepID=A0AAR2ISJ7_PYGNA
GALECASKCLELLKSWTVRYVLGHDAMRTMGKANVLISGMKGLGVEVAKNVVLAGVGSVTIQDQGSAEWTDLSSQFYLRESDLGENRALCSEKALARLNSHVRVSACTEALNQDFLRNFQVVVLTDSSLEEQRWVGAFCHTNNIRFIVADTKGLCGQLFCDFGEAFEVRDSDGESPHSAMITHISKENPGIVSCTDEQAHEFTDGMQVTFSGVQGMTELNSCGPIEIKPQRRLMSLYSIFNDWFQISQTQPLISMSFHKTDAELLVAMAKQLSTAANFDKFDEDVVHKLSLVAAGDLAPVNAFIGGLAAQEVMKACTGKFTPLKQWFYFDSLECLPDQEDGGLLTEEACAPRSSRYDGQVAVFGADFQEKIKKQRYFLVGAGAIGCELLKNFALIGLGAGEGGHITVTDMDSIERSNLNRQFLFRSEDIGRQKSEAAAEAVKKMNPSVNITAHQNRVCPESEGIYTHQFYSGLDGVAAALDNVDARVYLDGRCVQYQRPMLEGGTLGSKGHTLVVVPHLTESYGPASSSGQKAIPLCTLKHFPHRIEHTLQWARDQFEGLFKHSAENVNHDPEFWARTVARGEVEAVEVLEGVYANLSDRPQDWTECVTWARIQWESLYNNDIAQLLHCFPPNHVTSSGLPFWMGAKRCPHPLTFDPANTTHMDFVVAAANLYGQIYGIEGSRDHEGIQKILSGVRVPEFTPKSSVKIAVTDEELAESKERKEEGEQAGLDLWGLSPPNDDDSNFHMDYIVATSNLRAENYDIPAADRHKSKLIAGRIIPAIATTTAAVAGLMCLELYKLVQGHRRISSFRVAYVNMAVQYYVLSQPGRAPTFTVSKTSSPGWDVQFCPRKADDRLLKKKWCFK